MLPSVRTRGPQGPHNRPLVLVADDHEDTRLVFSETLQAAGFAVAFAADGREAVEACGRKRPDLVIMDLSMPALNGWEAIRALKLAEGTSGIPILVVTAQAVHHSRNLAEAAGCDAYLTKPCAPDELVRHVRALLGRPDRPDRSGRSGRARAG
jgi:two-component system, cell cycle response regulator DivK